jgi:hypothetical protein
MSRLNDKTVGKYRDCCVLDAHSCQITDRESLLYPPSFAAGADLT